MLLKKKAFYLIGILICSSTITFGNANDKANVQPTKEAIQEVSIEKQDGNWMYLTKEQRLKDFDYLYQELKENYPYFKVAKRVTGIDLDEQYKLTRAKIAECSCDEEYFEILQEYCNIGVGHLTLWGRRYATELEMYKMFATEDETMRRYYEILNNATSLKNYELMESYYSKEEKQIQDSINQVDDENEFENIETKIIEDGKVAYVKINTFDMNYFDESKEKLFSFYNKIKDYTHLIIDISDNGGGGMSYFDDLIVAPNIDKSLSVPTYMLIKNGKTNEKHLRLSKLIQEGMLKPVSEMPNLPKLVKSDLDDIDYFMKHVYEIHPCNKEKLFKGKIWMLVSENVYSSSEYAAMFTKASGFATLVGTQTGGDGIGIDPIHIVLPESGLVVQCSPIYGLSSDGTGSEEFGTTPDIISKNGEEPLQTCLNAISNE